MREPTSKKADEKITRERLAELLNEDLSREYQAIIAYVVYSQVLKGAEYMAIAGQLEAHAHDELKHALIISRQIDYLGKLPSVTPKPVRTSSQPKDMLRFDLENENETIRQYRDRVRQCEALGEFAMAEQIRQILMKEQDHQIDLATALGEDVPNVSDSVRLPIQQRQISVSSFPPGTPEFKAFLGAAHTIPATERAVKCCDSDWPLRS
jgi:bacterioferritin